MLNKTSTVSGFFESLALGKLLTGLAMRSNQDLHYGNLREAKH